MSRWIIPPHGNMIEPVPAPEFFSTGIGAVEIFEGGWRFYLVAEQLVIEAPSAAPQCVLVAKVVTSTAVLPKSIWQLAHCMMHKEPQEPPVKRTPPRLVK